MWSQTAGRLKAGPDRLRTARLGLAVVAAALALAGGQLKPVSETLSVILAVAAALNASAFGLRGAEHRGLPVHVAGWYTAPEPERLLEAEVRRLERDTGDLQQYTEGVAPVKRALPDVHDVDSYLDVRVRRSQLEGHYQPRALEAQRRLRVLKVVEVVLALIAAVLAALAAVSANVRASAAVVTTVGGAAATGQIQPIVTKPPALR